MTDSHITDEEYNHTKTVWSEFFIDKLSAYSGGMSQCSNRCENVKANNKYIVEYEPHKDSSYKICFDFNKL